MAKQEDLTYSFKVWLNEIICQTDIGDKIEELAHGHGPDTMPREEASDVGAVLLQECERVGVVVLDRLRHIDEVNVALVVKNVILKAVSWVLQLSVKATILEREIEIECVCVCVGMREQRIDS